MGFNNFLCTKDCLRILLIADYTPSVDLDVSVACYTQRAKRRRKLDCLDTVKTLWKFALSMVHVQGVFESASSLLLSLINKYRSELGDDEDLTDAISDILSRSTVTHGEVIYKLVTFLLTEFEFDEMKHFSGVIDKKKGLEEWRFRCQMAEWLICHLEPEGNIGELLFLLCSLHPAPVCKPSSHLRNSAKGIEHDLELFGLVEPQNSLKNSAPSIPVIIVDELVEYVVTLFSQCWSCSDISDEMRIALWCSFAGFLSKLEAKSNAEATGLLDVGDLYILEMRSYFSELLT
ncbi:hypothetical protein COOONC_25207 [Cooperia oncophora]